VGTKAEAADLKTALALITEYKVALRLIVASRSIEATDAASQTRQMELSSYATHCALEPSHLMLNLNLAMITSFKHKNFITAASFARRLLEMPDINSAKNATLLQKVRLRGTRDCGAPQCARVCATRAHTLRVARAPPRRQRR